MLDLSGNSAIPSHYRIGIHEVTKWIHQQSKGFTDVQLTRHYNRGAFIIQTGNEETAKFLASYQLEIKVNGVRHLVPLRRKVPDMDKTRIKFWQTCKGGIARVPNKYFDDILEAAGCIIDEPSFKSTYKDTTVYDGNRLAYVKRGPDHIERNHEYTDDNGRVFQWRLDYEGQPFYCFKGCGIFHEDGKCPKWEKMKERRANDGQQKCYIAASSLFRLASDTKTTQVVAIPGAKIGHIANHVNNDTKMFEKAEVLVIAAGSNMDRGTVEASKPFVEDQAKELVQVLKPMAETKKIFIVDPLPGRLNKEESAGHHWAMLRQRMKKVAKEAKATWVSLEAVDWNPEEDVGEDCVHYTAAGTKKVLEAIGAKVKEVTGVDLLLDMEVQEKPYAGVFNGHYKFGCPRCTKVHQHGRCPELNISINSPDNSNSINITAAGESFHSLEANNSNNSNNSSNNNGNNSLNLLGLESDDGDVIQPSQPVVAETQPLPLPHFEVTRTSSPLNPGSVIRADAVVALRQLQSPAAAPQPPQPLLRSPSFNAKEDEATISGMLRSNPEHRSRSSSVGKRSREDIDSLIGNSLEKKKKNNSDKKQNPHVSRVQKGGNTKK